MQPLVSVVVATYKRDEILLRALNSLATQTYKNFEIILVDDNANEEWNSRVKKIVDEFRENNKDISFKYIVNIQNQGSAKTRNTGIDASSGEFVTFLDDDDIYLPENLESQVENMLQTGADFGITDLDMFYDDETVCEKRTRSFIKSTSKEDLIKYHLKYHLAGTDTMIFKKSYLEKIGKFDPIDIGDEFYLMFKAIENGGKFTYLKGCFVKAYVHRGEGGLSSGDGKIEGENRLHEFKKKYFKLLTKADRKYIITRHFAVIAFAELRRKHYPGFFVNAFKAFFASPVYCMKILKEHK
ncbi:MAG: glycosyltransferase family 2 protein [Ruminococcaceae bacterium]|nr:glycosyltransferase family 2 protein [Oscillospiraceae bacterium]